jgi:nitrogenase subunit NifH
MRRKVGKKTQVKVDFASYSYLLNGIPGIGKSTMAVEVGQKIYGEDGLLLLTVGQEPKPDHIGNVLTERATDWDDLEEIIESLVEYKEEDYPDLKVIAIDTVDEVFRLAEAKVVEMLKIDPKRIIGLCRF